MRQRGTSLSLESLKGLSEASLWPFLEKFERWLVHERHVSPLTWTTYVSDLKQAFSFLTHHQGSPITLESLLKLSAQDFRAFLSFRLKNDISKRTNARTLSALKTFFRFLREQESHTQEDIARIRTPRLGRRLPRPLTQPQVLTLLEEKTTTQSWEAARDKALFALLYGGGLRISEALTLNQGDFPQTWSPGTCIRVMGKGRKERLVPLLPEVHALVHQALDVTPFPKNPQAPLFLSVRGKRLYAAQAANKMVELRAVFGLSSQATPHSLRHSFASHLLAGGVDLRHIQALLGHASLQSTQIYADIEEQHIRQVYEAAHPLGKKNS